MNDANSILDRTGPILGRWTGAFVALVAAVTFGAGCGGGSPAPGDTADAGPPPSPPDSPLLADGFLNIAHRGGGLRGPEETLAAYHLAVASGADVLEMDARSTSDGQIVLMHDASVDRTTDGAGILREMSFAEVMALDAGYKFTTDGGATYPFRGMGVQVATLREVLETFPNMLFSIEIKEPGITEAVLQIIDDAGVTERTVVAAFSSAVLLQARSLRPDLLTAMTVDESFEVARLAQADEASYRPPAWILQTPPSLADITVDAAFIARANRLKLKVHVWTINDPVEMQTLIELGTHGIMTDDPVALEGLRP